MYSIQLSEKLGHIQALSTETFHNTSFTYVFYSFQILIHKPYDIFGIRAKKIVGNYWSLAETQM